MLDMELIEDSIKDLEQKPTTFENCENLAILYICRLMNKHPNNLMVTTQNDVLSKDSISELEDIFPAYCKYVETKRRYQQYEVVDKMLIYAMEDLCRELTEFVSTLYSNTETEAERALIIKMISEDLRSAI